jgi:hypothetical protein
MSNEKRLVTVVAVVLVICALLSCNATPVVEALTATTLTIATNNTTPALNQQFTLSGTLKAGTTPLSGKPITLRRMDLSGQWSTISTTTTDTNGNYTFTRSESVQGTYSYYASFAGDTTYSTASSPFVTPSIGTYTATTLTIATNNTTPALNQQFTLSGTLKAGTTPLPGKSVELRRMDLSGQWSTISTTTTDTNGNYTFTRSESVQGTYSYYARFLGDTTYYASSSSFVTNPIGTYTATTITASKTSPAIGETVTFTVTLKSGTTLLSKPVKIWHSYPGGARSEDGTHTTSASGVYTFTQAFGSSGERVYHVEFAGDSMYASSSGAVTVNVAPG